MRNIGKFLKILVLGLILIVLSAGYRFFGKKNNDDNNFINKAKADTPAPGPGDPGYIDPGCGFGCDGGGCGSGGGGDS